jgi:hypothetical protein
MRVRNTSDIGAPEELDAALSRLPNTFELVGAPGGGRRLRHFVWSSWNGSQLDNQFNLCRGLDGTLTDADIILSAPLRAAMKALNRGRRRASRSFHRER